MAGDGQLPDERLFTLYRQWAAGGTGLLITGNAMVHAEALTGPAGVVLDEHAPLGPFAEWAEAGKSGGGAIWMQINHPGRQVPSGMPESSGAVRHRRQPGQAQQPVRPPHRDDRAADRRHRDPVRGDRPPGREGPASTAWRSTPRTATCCHSSSPPWSTSAPTSGAGPGEPRPDAPRHRPRRTRRRLTVVRGRGQAELLRRLPARGSSRRRGRPPGHRDARTPRRRPRQRTLRRQLRESGRDRPDPPATRTQAREAYFLDLARDLVTTSPSR